MTKELIGQVTRIEYNYNGHYRRGELEMTIEGSGWGCKVYPIRKPNTEHNLIHLFEVFDVDSENGASLEELVGWYCKVVFDEKGNVVELRNTNPLEGSCVWENKRIE